MPNHYILTQNGELYHYGVKGMKWGVRRYQNEDGTLTAAGKKRARQEVRADNKEAYELGKTSTIYGRAAAKSMKRTIKYENRLDKQYAKDPDGVKGWTKRLRRKWDASAATTAQLVEMYVVNKKRAEQHCNNLIDKYGNEAVKSIKYKDVKLPKGEYSPESFKTMNERTNNLTDYAVSGAATVSSLAFSALMGAPIAMIFSPTTTGEKASRLESMMYSINRQEQRQR